MFEIDKVPRDPDKAVDYLIAYALSNLRTWFVAGSLYEAKRGEVAAVLFSLSTALSVGRYSDTAKRCGRSMLKAFNDGSNLRKMNSFEAAIHDLNKQVTEEKLSTHYDVERSLPEFSLDANDLEQAVALLARMRSFVVGSDFFSVEHKRRILNRIAAVEAEVFQQNGRLEVILAAAVSIGEACGRFTEKAKPLFDAIAEIRGIAERKSHGREELPAPDKQKQLPPPK